MKGSEIISRAINGSDGIKVRVGGKIYEIKPPTISIISLVGEALSSIRTDDSIESVLNNILHGDCFAKALSRLLGGNDDLYEEFLEADLTDVVIGVEKGLSLLSSENWEKKIGFDQEKNDSKTETAGNATLLGQIATFIDNLHLSYDDVVYKIPYRNLVVMQRDKLHTVFGKKVKKASGREMAARRSKNNG